MLKTKILTVVAPEIPGDINEDGNIDATDIALFSSVLVGTETNPSYVANSDMNSDSTANGEDVQPFVNAFLQ